MGLLAQGRPHYATHDGGKTCAAAETWAASCRCESADKPHEIPSCA